MIISKPKKQTELQKKFQEWAGLVKNRDGWCCVICGSTYAPNAHHIIPRENKVYAFDVDNGITLCVKHHKFSRQISAHNNPMAFLMWLRKYKYHYFNLAEERNREMLIGDIAV